jgi:transcription factor IIIB subunit 2
MPVLPEDLIWRFAHKLDFKTETNKVAEDAVRLVKRMSLDWMVMGRRPSGVCGACLILAARMNNFRRTVTEVVYVVKVTTATIQKRLDEFKRIPSSALTVEEFLSNEFLESAHDPPSYYEKQESFIKTKKTRKRKRKGGEDPEGQANAEGGNPDAAIPSVELRRDADGFAIPPQPTQEPQRPEMAIDPALLEEAVGEESGAALKKLVHAYGDAINDALSDDDDEEEEEEEGTPGPSKRDPKPHREIHVPDLWAEDERTLESQIDEIVGDPNTIAHARAYARACKRANKYMKFLHHTAPQRDVNMDVHIGEDEFADDPEVVNALLGPADVAAKERVWVNENKSWLRKQQLKEYQKRIAADGPPKATRNRKKKPRIGEGQEGPANTPEEAAIETLKRRTWSKKINYKMVNKMLSGFEKSLGGMGSAGSSRAPSAPISEAGSMIEDDDEESENGSVMGSVAGSEFSSASSRRPIIPPPKPIIPTLTPRPTPALSNAEILARGPTPTPSMASKDELEDEEEDDEEEDWKKSLKRGRGIEDDGEEEEEDDYVEDYTQGDVMEVDEGEGDVDAGGEYEGNWDAEEDLYGAD